MSSCNACLQFLGPCNLSVLFPVNHFSRSALFCDVAQRMVVIPYRDFWTTYRFKKSKKIATNHANHVPLRTRDHVTQSYGTACSLIAPLIRNVSRYRTSHQDESHARYSPKTSIVLRGVVVGKSLCRSHQQCCLW